MLGFFVDRFSLFVIFLSRSVFLELNLKNASKGRFLVLLLHVELFVVVTHVLIRLILINKSKYK